MKLGRVLDEVVSIGKLLVTILARVELPVEVDCADVTGQTFSEISLEVAVLASVLRHHIVIFVTPLVIFLDVNHK